MQPTALSNLLDNSLDQCVHTAMIQLMHHVSIAQNGPLIVKGTKLSRLNQLRGYHKHLQYRKLKKNAGGPKKYNVACYSF